MRIEHIDEVLPHVAGRDDFVVAHKDGYSVIDYIFVLPDSFDHPMRVECRGLKFGPDGRLIARPLPKFWNVNEKPHTQAGLIDMSEPHVITEKLDGSMIHPAIVNDKLVLMTRMGHTDVAKWAEELLTPKMIEGMRGHLETGFTPIFEFTSLKNRVIIRHEKPELHLLAVRDTRLGSIIRFTADGQAKLASELFDTNSVPFVSNQWASMIDFVEYARAIQGQEGFVVRFESGLWLKMKGDDYVLKHKSKDATSLEKNVLAMVINDALDDVLPLLDPEYRTKVEDYAAEVREGMAETAMMIGGFVGALTDVDQKTFAVKHVSGFTQPVHKALAFQVRAGKEPLAAVKQAILKNTGSQPDVDSVRHLFGAWWES